MNISVKEKKKKRKKKKGGGGYQVKKQWHFMGTK